MKEVLLLKIASEIHLKSDFVRKQFENTLLRNIRIALKNNKIDVKKLVKKRGKIFLELSDNKKAIQVLRKVFGLSSIAKTNYVEVNGFLDVRENLLKFALAFLKPNDSFALRVSRNGNHSFSSQEIAISSGKAIQDSLSVSVNLSSPKKEIFVELDENDLFLFSEIFEAARGIPVGVEGKVALLMNGDFNEFFAGKLFLKRGCNIIPVILKNKQKSLKVLKKLSDFNSFQDFSPFIVSSLDELRFNFDAFIVSFDTPSKHNLNALTDLQKKFNIAVFAPLLCLPKGVIK